MGFEQCGFAPEPEAPYELRDQPGGYGCEDRITFISILDTYVISYVVFGPRGPEVALAISEGALPTKMPRSSLSPFARHRESLALYHRPTLDTSVREGESAVADMIASSGCSPRPVIGTRAKLNRARDEVPSQ